MHVMAKPTGAACNLRCDYCFFLEKERLYPGDRTRMTDEVLEAYIRQYMEAAEARTEPRVTIAWQGGEPMLMGLDFFRRSVEIADSHAPEGMAIEHTIQTNGVLIDEEWCDFFRRNRFLVGLSLDGPAEYHDLYRHDARGRPTFDRVMRAATLMKDRGVDFNVLCSVHAGNQEHPLEVYRFLTGDVGVEWIQLIPIVERVNDDGTTLLQQGDTVTDRSVDPLAWGGFLSAVYDEWLPRHVGRVHVNFLETAFASFVGAPALACIFAETCGDALVLEHNGDLYSCDHFVEPGYLLGNIMETPLGELASSKAQKEFGDAKRDALPSFCSSCEFLFACRGECPKNRFATAPDGEPGLNYLCEGYRRFFDHIGNGMRALAGLYSRGLPPGDILSVFAAAGRNDPCPCGSGLKYKRCHGGE